MVAASSLRLAAVGGEALERGSLRGNSQDLLTHTDQCHCRGLLTGQLEAPCLSGRAGARRLVSLQGILAALLLQRSAFQAS